MTCLLKRTGEGDDGDNDSQQHTAPETSAMAVVSIHAVGAVGMKENGGGGGGGVDSHRLLHARFQSTR